MDVIKNNSMNMQTSDTIQGTGIEMIYLPNKWHMITQQISAEYVENSMSNPQNTVELLWDIVVPHIVKLPRYFSSFQ